MHHKEYTLKSDIDYFYFLSNSKMSMEIRFHISL